MKRLLLAASLVWCVFHVNQFQAQSTSGDAFVNYINEEDLKKHLFELASDAYEGRETGTPGQQKAAEYIAAYYKELGLPAVVNGSYFQQYPLKRERYGKSTVTAGKKSYAFINDFFFFGSDAAQDISVNEFVFVGYGIDDPKYSDYKGVDVKEKVVMCYGGEPMTKDGKSIITGAQSTSEWTEDFRLKIDAALKNGAKALMYVDPEFEMYLPRIRFWLEQPRMTLDYPSSPESSIPYIFIGEKMADELLAMAKKKSVKKYIQAITKKGQTKTVEAKTSLRLQIVHDEERIDAENVLGFIEGSDAQLKNEIVIISAHYDHIGIVNGQINNGADDDGSGTVSTLEIAQAFVEAKKAGAGPRRSVLILNVSGEEKGLLGSEWYSEYPVFPLANTVCDLNIDMIGRVDEAHAADENYVYLIGSDKLSTSLHAISERNNAERTKLKLDYTYNDPEDPNRFYYRSDHYNFAKHNIPVIFYFSGVHEDYHQPGDDAEKIRFGKMTTIAQLVFYTAWEVANRDERLKVDVKSDFK